MGESSHAIPSLLAVGPRIIVFAAHNWVGLGLASVPGSPWGTYYDQEFGDLYGYYDTTVLPPEPALGASASLQMLPAAGQSFVDDYVGTMQAPTPISIATLNADMTCASMCPAGDQWFPGNEMTVGGSTPTPFMPPLSQSQMVFAGLATNAMPYVGASAWAGFWPGGTVLPDSYGASSVTYLVP